MLVRSSEERSAPLEVKRTLEVDSMLIRTYHDMCSTYYLIFITIANCNTCAGQ